MENEIAVRQETGLENAATANEIRAQVNRIQEVMRAVMKNGIHYGTIPGAGDKPALFKPGAEKIFATFRISVDPIVESETRLPDEYTVRVKAVATCGGRELGSAFGEASSNEEKYRWRRAVCQEEYDETPEDQRRMAFKKYQGKVNRVPQVRTHVADISNTILKMAVKRAEVALCLQVTGASDVFAQDIEDLPEGVLDNADKPAAPAMPKRKSEAPPAEPAPNTPAPAPAADADRPPDREPPEALADALADELPLDGEIELHGVVKLVTRKPGKSAKGEYVKCGVCVITDKGEQWANTFDTKLADDAEGLKGRQAILYVKHGKYGLDLVGIGQ